MLAPIKGFPKTNSEFTGGIFSFPEWGLPKSDIERSQLLGQGEFGEVHSGVYRGAQVAVKSIHESKESAAAIANFLREASFMT